MSERHAVFLVNLLQDVNIIRPLVFMTARDLGMKTVILVIRNFHARDKTGAWGQELSEICEATGAVRIEIDDAAGAIPHLEGKSGVLVAASESNLKAHKPTHDIFVNAPASFLKVNLQHGYESVGLLQSRDHDRAHGQKVAFGADIVCSWSPPSVLKSLLPSQLSKIYVTGPSTILQMTPPRNLATDRIERGIVCENLHSVRLNVSGDFKLDFMSVFNDFCSHLGTDGRKVTLRPHPGGQYVLKQNVELPGNVTINNNPIYKVDLPRYSYGISAPSSVIIDMVLAGIPTAVWSDAGSVMDADNYAGLTHISTLSDWIDFSREAVAHPMRFITAQEKFLEKLRMPTDPMIVYERFAKLFDPSVEIAPAVKSGVRAKERVLFVEDSLDSHLHSAFLDPLEKLEAPSELEIDVLHEKHMIASLAETSVQNYLDTRMSRFDPTSIVLSQYRGPQLDFIVDWARDRKIPVVQYATDRLFNVPPKAPNREYQHLGRSKRLANVKFALDQADLVYCSTPQMQDRIAQLGNSAHLSHGTMTCSGEITTPAEQRPVTRVGYICSGYQYDFDVIVPAVCALLQENPGIGFDYMGELPLPEPLTAFGDRVRTIPVSRSYKNFLKDLAGLGWDIGLCPLSDTDVSFGKSNDLWVQLTACGAAVIATRHTAYEPCCADGCGILVDAPDEWPAALMALASDPQARFDCARKAQERLSRDYTPAAHRAQIFDMLEQARANRTRKLDTLLDGHRILYIANGFIPTLQLSFIKPLAPIIETGRTQMEILTEKSISDDGTKPASSDANRPLIQQKLESFDPTIIVFCRYSGPHLDLFLDWANEKEVPVLYQVDDDLLNVPENLGQKKFRYHNAPERLATVKALLNRSDLIYASNIRLKDRIASQGAKAQIKAGAIYCSAKVLSPAVERPVRKVGYMASADHSHNLVPVLPAIARYLRANPDVQFEFFGSIPIPPELAEFKSRVNSAPPIANYNEFLEEFSKYEWDIGICPLTPIMFNLMKANTKWVEYTAVGAAVVASRGTVYDDCCSDGCGILAATEDDWFNALQSLTTDPRARFEQVTRAQEKLTEKYSTDALKDQVLRIFEKTMELRAARKPRR